VCVCVSEGECVRVRARECVCVSEGECEGECVRVRVSVYVSEGECVFVSVCV
jgi:hypothetical protein